MEQFKKKFKNSRKTLTAMNLLQMKAKKKETISKLHTHLSFLIIDLHFSMRHLS